MKTPEQQMRAMRRALMRIGEYHGTEGAIARLCLMDCTGKHPWADAKVSRERFKEHVTYERNLSKNASK